MSDPTIPTPRCRRPWALSFFGLLAIAGLVALPIFAGPLLPGKMPDTVRFIGHFHPLLLHLPIGVMVLVLFQDLGAIFFRTRDQFTPAPVFPMFFAAASAIMAVLAGFLLYHGGGYENNATAERHLWGGLAFAVLAVLTCIVRAWTAAPTANPAMFRLLLFLTVGVMGFASHDGASLTHGGQYLTEFAPEPLRQFFGLAPKAPAAAAKALPDQLVFADLVAPILERRCAQCHKEGKSKGGLRMDSHELLMKGGKKGPVIAPGEAAKSQLVKLTELPPDDLDHMPPAGKPQPTPEELTVLKWWIDQGADATKTVKDLPATPAITAALAALAPAAAAAPAGSAATAPAAASPGPDEALKTAVAALAKEFPGSVTFESQQSTLVTFTAASLRSTLDDAAFAKFAPIFPQLVTADFSATKITDQAVAQLSGATKLRMIRLAATPITDAAIETLLKLPALESINLYGTKITDAGALKLADLPKLKHLYLWQTAVTPAAVTALREKLPQCEIVTGTPAQ